MSFFETHAEDCKPSAPCARCRLHNAIFKIDNTPVRYEVLRLINEAFQAFSGITKESLEDGALELSIDDLGFNTRVRNALFHDNIKTVGDLVQKTRGELLRIPNFGRHSLTEVEEALSRLKLCLAPRA